MAKAKTSRSSSKKKNSKKSAAPPPPPPTLLRAHTMEQLEQDALQFPGSALLCVVAPICSTSVNNVVPALEKLNDARPSALDNTNIVVVYATEATEDMCELLQVTSVPYFASYSYGKQIASFAGDNMEKATLLAKLAAAAAVEEAERIAATQLAAAQQDS